VTNLNEQDDDELLALVRKGDHKAYAVLVRRHSRGAYAVAYRFVGDCDEAEDLVQSAFLKLWERPGMWNPALGGRFTTWFYRIIVNLCLDWHKKRKPLLINDAVRRHPCEAEQEKLLLVNERQALLEVQINALPERQRIAVNLSYGSGLSNKEAAEVMGVSLRALQSLLMRAKSTLKKRMENLCYESFN
jgi:RNA polymerase sigma-70 factor (ECF subfamily)